MPRTRISRDLGPLPRGSVSRGIHGKTDTLLQILRSLALKNQGERPRVFYSLREVARQFRVPISTVASTYHDLEKEGLLTRMRGSRTVLNGLRHNRRLSIRAFVGLPALFSHYIGLQEYRNFFIYLERELWSRGFAATTVFFRPNEEADGTLLDRLKSYGVDAVIWLQPSRTAKEPCLRLADLGIHVVVISQIGTPGLPSRYYVWREYAIDALLRDWKDRTGLRKITLITSKAWRPAVTEEVLFVILDNLGIEPVIRNLDKPDTSAFLRGLCGIKTQGIIFPNANLVSFLAFRSPDELVNLLRAQRVAFVDGPTDLPFADIPDAPVDIVTFDWQAVSESIVSDLITREAFDHNRHATFHAQAHLRVPLNRFAEEIRPTR